MMKKYGFTLAEVLITLAIIGVVATMTLPALMTNTAEQQAKTGLKKGINVLTEAAQMNQAIEGFDYGSLKSDAIDPNPQTMSLYSLLASRTSIDFNKSGDGVLGSSQGGDDEDTSNYAVFFRDGSALLFDPANIDAGNKQDDGLVQGIGVIFDTNGAKGPNILSNCQGQSKGVTTDVSGDDLNAVCAPANRVIKDQFGVRLRDGYAVPNGAAARWAFEN